MASRMLSSSSSSPSADRDYYVKEDEAHLGLIETYITGPGSVVEHVSVVDFTPGTF